LAASPSSSTLQDKNPPFSPLQIRQAACRDHFWSESRNGVPAILSIPAPPVRPAAPAHCASPSPFLLSIIKTPIRTPEQACDGGHIVELHYFFPISRETIISRKETSVCRRSLF